MCRLYWGRGTIFTTFRYYWCETEYHMKFEWRLFRIRLLRVFVCVWAVGVHTVQCTHTSNWKYKCLFNVMNSNSCHFFLSFIFLKNRERFQFRSFFFFALVPINLHNNAAVSVVRSFCNIHHQRKKSKYKTEHFCRMWWTTTGYIDGILDQKKNQVVNE